MTTLAEIAPAFVKMAHQIVWCTTASVDRKGRPRSRVLHPLWEWDGVQLVGWIATGPTPLKRAHLEVTPHLSCNYWEPSHDTCVAECAATWAFDDATRTRVWQAYVDAPAPVGYDPSIIPGWDGPTSPSFAALRLDPWRIRVMPGTVMLKQTGDTLVWEK